MQRAGRRASRGFTLLELVIVICVIGLLTVIGARRLLALRVEAERAALTQVVGGLQAAVSLEMLSRVSRGEDDALADLADSNPMDLLVEPPWSYLGELDGPDPARVKPGRWYFDRRSGQLVYRVRYADRFRSALPGPARAAFRVELVWDDRNGNGRFDPGVDGVAGARLRRVADYGWVS